MMGQTMALEFDTCAVTLAYIAAAGLPRSVGFTRVNVNNGEIYSRT